MPSDPNAEQERLMRLRQRQLADRDPHIKQRKFQQNAARRERRAAKGLSLKQAWADIPHVWKNIFYALIVGVLALFIVPALWLSPWAVPCAAGGTLALLVFGVIVGRAMDTREEIKRLAQ